MHIKKTLTVALAVALAVAAASAFFLTFYPASSPDVLDGFVSEVVGVDLSKYSQTAPIIASQVQDEYPSKRYSSSQGVFEASAVLRSGRVESLKINVDHSLQTKHPPNPDLTVQAVGILNNYKNYTQNHYSATATYLQSIEAQLLTVDSASPKNGTLGDLVFEVASSGDATWFRWFNVVDGARVDYQAVEVAFRGGQFYMFKDSWGVYSVGAHNQVSLDQAVDVAWAAAAEYNVTVVEDGQNRTFRAIDVLSEHFDSSFTFAPPKDSVGNRPSSTSRAALSIYPIWQFSFYFKEPIAELSGVQVAVWGDTGEVLYCQELGYHNFNGSTYGC